MTERKPENEDWESFVERQIRESQEAGEFDNLPGFGKPIPDIDQPYDENWWIKKKSKRERLSLLPPALRIRADVERTLEQIWTLNDETQVRQTLERLNQRIKKTNFAITWGPASTTMPLDVEAIVSQWHRRRDQA